MTLPTRRPNSFVRRRAVPDISPAATGGPVRARARVRARLQFGLRSHVRARACARAITCGAFAAREERILGCTTRAGASMLARTQASAGGGGGGGPSSSLADANPLTRTSYELMLDKRLCVVFVRRRIVRNVHFGQIRGV